MGGGELARPLFEAGLIDEIGFNIHPVLLGSGIPLFHRMSRQIDLDLLECRQFKTGCVLVRYRMSYAAFSTRSACLARRSVYRLAVTAGRASARQAGLASSHLLSVS